MAAPTFLEHYPSSFNSSTSPKSALLSNLAQDDVIVAGAMREHASVGVSLADSEGFTIVDEYESTPGNSDRGYARAWSIIVPFAVGLEDLSFSSSGAPLFGGAAIAFGDSGGIGNVAGKQRTVDEAATVTLTTTEDNSAVVCFVTDWNALDGASRVWATINGETPTQANTQEIVYHRSSANYTVYAAYWNDVGAAGPKTVGLTTPGATMRPTMVAVEVLGSGVTLQEFLPDADLATTGWTTAPLFSKVNDNSDATLITGALT